MDNGLPTSIVIFGASGDLTQRKLVPSLFNLYRKGRLPKQFRIVGYGNTAFSDDQFRAHLKEGLKEFASFKYKSDEWGTFASNLVYQQGRYTDLADFKKLGNLLKNWEINSGNRIYYMATPPGVFPNIIDLLGLTDQLTEYNGWRRVVIEKPFGTDLESARSLNEQIHKTLNERQIYRIDHYLGKETVQNILMTRFANTIFEPLWNRNYIDHVEITVAEQVGVEHRGRFYDNVGVLRDMFQNHLLQLTSLVAMEPPASFDATALRNEKVKVLSSIRSMKEEEVLKWTVGAQYKGYREEEGVDPKSTTPTYAAIRLQIDNWRWQGVPFYLRSGKSLKEKLSQITIEFKKPPHLLFPSTDGALTANMLVLYLQPHEGVHWRFEAKVPDTVAKLRSVDMEFHYDETFGKTALPEAYERLLLDTITGDASLFTRADEVESAWALIDPITEAWEASRKNQPLAFYEPGSWGPSEADELLAHEGRTWSTWDARKD
ncbi:MAG: glucose-6-phosphate dehydrogenase [Anaerolineae bacterium]|nr:glucose-6-phosphate dehydrogenase [Anaerolineae bacterium]MCI0611232.1 glucose-6-phosphate dehydrogenase [Anaerolineae bacterium]